MGLFYCRVNQDMQFLSICVKANVKELPLITYKVGHNMKLWVDVLCIAMCVALHVTHRLTTGTKGYGPRGWVEVDCNGDRSVHKINICIFAQSAQTAMFIQL